MNRNFARSTLDVDHRTSAYKITCRQCGKTDKVAAASHSGSLPPEVSAKKFRQRGWTVGNREGDDLCNICVAANKIARKQTNNVIEIPTLKLQDLSKLKELQDLAQAHLAAENSKPTLAQEAPVEKLYNVKEAAEAGFSDIHRIYRAINTNKFSFIKNERGAFVIKESELIRVFGQPKQAPAKEAAPLIIDQKPLVNDGVKEMNFDPKLPPEMTKEDRRIIFSEIDSHYLDEMRGYAKDWNDERVAKGLNVPQAWVRTIREDNFGPEQGDQVGIEVEKLKAASAEAEKLIKTMRELWDAMDRTLLEYETKQSALSGQATKIHAALAEAKAKIDAYTSKK